VVIEGFNLRSYYATTAVTLFHFNRSLHQFKTELLSGNQHVCGFQKLVEAWKGIIINEFGPWNHAPI